MSLTWRFAQLKGTDRKTIELSGYAAPFGRPRIKPVVETGKKARIKTTRYPGNSGAPTRHFFGTDQRDFTLDGRWMDKVLGAGKAAELVSKWEQFIQDEVPISIEWGYSTLSYVGVVEEIEVKWESQNEVAWTLHFLIDTNEFDGKEIVAAQAPNVSPAQTADDTQTWLNEQLPQIKSHLPSLDAVAGELVDTLDDLVGDVTQFGGIVVGLAGTISEFEDATFDELNRLKAGLHQFKTAVLILKQTVDTIKIDALVFDRQAEDDIAWLTFKTKSDQSTNDILGTTADAITAIDRAQRGVSTTTYTAQGGDTWESISTRVYGGPSGADKLRQANGIKYGALPVSGFIYHVPK